MATTKKKEKKEAVIASHKTPAALLIIKSSKNLVSDRVHESSLKTCQMLFEKWIFVMVNQFVMTTVDFG